MSQPEQFRGQETLNHNPELSERQQLRYQTCLRKHVLAQSLEQRISNLNASVSYAKTNFIATRFDQLKLANSKSLAVQDVQQRVSNLAQHAIVLQDEFRAENTEHRVNAIDRLADFKNELATVRASLNALHTPVIESEDLAGVRELEAIVRQYEAIIPPDLYRQPRQSAAADKVQQDAGIALRLVGMTLAGVYTAYSAIAGWKSGNMAPALMGAALTAATIFGTKRLLEGQGDQVVRETAYLNSREYDAFFRRYGMGKTWGKTIEELQGHGSELRALLGEKDVAKRQIMLKDIGLSKQTAERAALILKNPNDFALLVRICNEGSAETKATIARFVEQGAPQSALAIASNPQSLGENHA